MDEVSIALRELKGFRFDAAEFEGAVTELKNINIESLNVKSLIDGADFKLADEKISVGDLDIGEFEEKFRLGEMNELSEALNLDVQFSSSEEASIKTELKTFVPEFKVKEMETTKESVSTELSGLDDPTMNEADLAEKISTDSKLGTASKKMFAKLTKLGLVAVGIYATYEIYETFEKTVAEGKKKLLGFFVLTTASGKTTGCKLADFSCGGNVDGVLCGSAISSNINVNMHVLLTIALKDEAIITNINKILTDAGSTVRISSSDTVTGILSDANKYAELQKSYVAIRAAVVVETPCTVENVSEGCINFNPSADTKTVAYLDDSKLPSNQVVKCVASATALDVLVDIASNGISDLFSDLGNIFASGSGKYIGIALLIAFIAMIIIAVWKFATKKKSQ